MGEDDHGAGTLAPPSSVACHLYRLGRAQHAILAEIRKACARKEWSGLTEMLVILGSWGDTLSEEDVLRYLRDVTQSGTMMAEVFEQSLLMV